MLGGLGIPELLVIMVILVLFFGVGKLPKLGRGLGEGIRFFKEGLRSPSLEGEDPAPPTTDKALLPGQNRV